MSGPRAPRALREVLRGSSEPVHASVRRALDLLEAGQETLSSLAHDLAAGLEGGAGDVLSDRPDRLLYATDASIYEMEPLAVVFPRSAEDVSHAVRVAGVRGVPVLPRGAATSLSGQTVNHAVVVDCSRYLNRILEIDEEGQWARVEPGVTVEQLNAAALPLGLHYAIDPSTKNRATLGGGIANNSCGTHSVIYGKTIDQVIELDVVLADGSTATFAEVGGSDLENFLSKDGLEGDIYRAVLRIADEQREEIERRYPKIQRRVSGYNLDEFTGDGPVNLAKVVVGSEGTLAFVTSARVRLEPLPALRGLAAVHFESIAAACAAVVPALAHEPAAVELADSTIIERCRESIGYRSLVDFVIGEPGGLLLIELFDDDAAHLRARLEAVARDLEDNAVAYGSHLTVDPAEQLRIWSMRSAGLGILMSVKGDAKPVAFVEDTAVPPERLGEWVVRFDEVVRRHGTTAAYYGHASVGCLHIRPLVVLKTEDGLATAHTLASEIADMVLEFGGSLSGEHGDGIVRGIFTERMFGPQLTAAFRELKQAFDPNGILNPGKIIDTPPFRDNLRLGPETRNRRPRTYLDFSADGGLAPAVELCNGQATCRKADGGMCPSFMVTGDEEHSTRGRANLLRQVLNGALPADQLGGRRIYEALDLCVECKACKAECPSGVDMAKLKYEVLTRYHRQNGTPLRSRLFGRISTIIRLQAAFPVLISIQNRLARFRFTRALLHRMLGIHRDRQLPPLARQGF
ncbi:MAG: FAD-binding and (Fe-S)-binding domain-containing protein, partial [Dehalococcoidia bacterium]